MIVKGRGNPDSPYLFLGEKPGKEELKVGKVFVGKTGIELSKILWKAGIKEDDIWLDNLLEDAPTGKDYEVTDEDISRNLPRILELFGDHRFTTVVAMGAQASRFMLGGGIRADIGTVHGLAHEVVNQWCGWPDTLRVFSTYHPAAALHDGDVYPFIAYDFQLAGAMVSGEWQPPIRKDEYPDARYTPLTDSDNDLKVLCRLFARRDKYEYVFVDTEGSVENPWCLTFALEPGEGYMIQARDKVAVQQLKACVDLWKLTVVCHYAVHDIPVLRAMGWDLTDNGPDKILDTMVMAYLLQVEPQGLKNLCYRHCAMEMKDYVDVVGPYTDHKRIDYLRLASEFDWGRPEPVLQEKKTETKIIQPKGMNARIQTILGKIEAGEEVDIYKWWRDGYPELRQPVIETFGDLPHATLDDIPFEQVMHYACRDADGTGRVFWRLKERIDAMDLRPTLVMDCRCILMIEEMQTTGFRVDPDHFKRLVTEWRGEQGKIRKTLAEDYVGHYFNPESRDQVAPILFETWGLPVFKMTDGGKESTSDKAIDWLKDRHPGVGLIARHREYDKGITAFAEPIIEYAKESPDERLHAQFKYTRVVSGRFSASDPALLTMPVRSDLGKEIRNGFIAKDGCLLGSWDLNQIEMRFMAHESQDPDLIQAYKDNKDIHRETASRMFGCGMEAVTDEQRQHAKIVGFGIINGIMAAGLRDQFYLAGVTQYTEAQCDDLLRAWFEARPGVRRYLESCRSEARRYGHVRESVGGRMRYLQAVQSTDKRVVAEAERASHSHKISSGAQAILKKAMYTLWPMIEELRKADGVWIKWILQVHDELIFEFTEGYEEVLDVIVKEALCNSVKLRVPIKAKGTWARTWGKLK